MSYPTYEVLQVTKPADHVIHVQLNRPDKSNAMNGAFIRCVEPLIAASIVVDAAFAAVKVSALLC